MQSPQLINASVPRSHSRYAGTGVGTDAKQLREREKQITCDQGQHRPIPPALEALNESVAREVLTYWKEPCEALFGYLVDRYPDELAALIQSGTLAAHDLTYAAETMGVSENSARVREVLIPHLQSASPLVREGAIYGLQKHLNDEIRELIRKLAKEDGSPGVREAAEEALVES